jgi:hypothetical protein
MGEYGIEVNSMVVTVRLINPMLGTVPKSKHVYTDYVESKKPTNGTADLSEVEAETVMEALEAKGWTGFHADENGLFVYDYFIKGFFKNAGNILKDQLKVKNLRSKLDNNLFIFPRRVSLGKKLPDGCVERPIRCQTMQGPRVTIAKSDSVDAGTEFSFEVVWLETSDVKEEKLKKMLGYGKLQGFGQFRGGGYGQFEVVTISPTAIKDLCDC